MKPRRVVVTVELETATSIKGLKEMAKDGWDCWDRIGEDTKVLQVQVNVIKGKK